MIAFDNSVDPLYILITIYVNNYRRNASSTLRCFVMRLDWANGNPSLFWKMADEHERKNGAANRELEVALPAELEPVQQVALLQVFVKAELSGKPYQLAIHEPSLRLVR